MAEVASIRTGQPVPPPTPEPARAGDPVGAALIYVLGVANGVALGLLLGWLS